jgi:hypothetical protein
MRVSPGTGAGFVLSVASESPRCAKWNAHYRDFVATSRPAGGTYLPSDSRSAPNQIAAMC